MMYLISIGIIISAFMTLLSGNIGIVITNITNLINKSLEVNSLSNYWDSVKKGLNTNAIYSSITTISLAIAAYFVLVPMIYYNRYFFKNSQPKNQGDGVKNNKDYFKNVDSVQVERLVLMLHNQLPSKPTNKNYQLSLQMLVGGIRENDPLDIKLQKIADHMQQHLFLSKPIKIITLTNIPAGKYERIGDLNCIYVNSDIGSQNIEQKIAILAHEMAHYYLDVNQIRFSETNDNELLTEVCASYIGFGILMLDGYKVNHNKKQNAYQKVGYVDEKVILEAIILTANIRKQNPNWIIKNVSLESKLILRYRLRKLMASYKANKKKKT